MESFESMGYFWLPGPPGEDIRTTPPSAVPGTLTFDPVSGGRLELLGSLGNATQWNMQLPEPVELVHGFVQGDHRCVTLQNCLGTYSTTVPHLFSETRFVYQFLFRGYNYWFDDVESVRFREVSAGYTYLDDWMDQNNFRLVGTDGVEYVMPDPVVVNVDDLRVEIWSALSMNSTIMETSFRNEYRVTVQSAQETPFQRYLELINVILPHFFSLATGVTNNAVNVGGLRFDDKLGMKICFPDSTFVEKSAWRTPWPMLFTFSDVKDRLARYLANWISKYDKLMPICDLYFRPKHSKLRLLHSEIVDLCNALEAFHRNFIGGEYMNRREYKRVVSELMAVIPSDLDPAHRDALTSKIRYGNQYVLRKRLEQVCSAALEGESECLMALLGDIDGFIRRVVATRNYFTHLDGKPSKAVFDSEAMFGAVRRLRVPLADLFPESNGVSVRRDSAPT